MSTFVIAVLVYQYFCLRHVNSFCWIVLFQQHQQRQLMQQQSQEQETGEMLPTRNSSLKKKKSGVWKMKKNWKKNLEKKKLPKEVGRRRPWIMPYPNLSLLRHQKWNFPVKVRLEASPSWTPSSPSLDLSRPLSIEKEKIYPKGKKSVM